MSFSENLQFIRTRESVTQEQLAEQLSVSRQSVSKWESGASFPEMDTLLRICELYRVDLDTLLRGSVEDSSRADTAGYDAFMTRFAKRMAFSVGSILCGVAALCILHSLGVPEMLCVALLLLVITVSVVVIIASAMQQEHFCRTHPVIPDFYTDEERSAFHQKLIWYIAGGVGAILLGVTLLLLTFTVLPEREPYESLTCGVFLLFIAGAVTSFIYGGMMEDKFKIDHYNRDNNPTPEAKAQLNKIGTACGVIMLLATAVYVGFGLARDTWDTLWWVFAVGGILCGVVHTVWNPYKGEE